MTSASISNSNLKGALCATVAAMCFSLNDVGIKFLSDTYALHQIVFYRSLIGILTFALIIMPISGGLKTMSTRLLHWHLARGLCVVAANSFLFLGLASLPIADAVAIFFVSPLVIAVFSVIFLGEHVGPRRWAAIAIGLLGVLIMVKPGTSAFQIAAILPAISAALYALMHIIARRIGGTESAGTMTFWILVSFMTVSATVGLAIGDGRYASGAPEVLTFLLRAWAPLDPADIPIFVMLGTSGIIGGFLISQAYRIAEAAFAAPFEYVSMPMAVIWGVVVFGTFPGVSTWVGIALILGSGLAMIYLETRRPPAPRPDTKVYSDT
ncbi:DMT family transporter [Roseovarius nubinhibens]|uniref:DMT family transporter n=1 Tax=Roseovarius nubinhibens TaxID=314263 RepID=UPI0030EE0F21